MLSPQPEVSGVVTAAASGDQRDLLVALRALIPELVAAGVEFSTLTTGDVGRSCGWFQEAVKDGLIVQPIGR